MMLAEMPDIMSVRQVAYILRISPATLKIWGKRGKLIPMRITPRGDRRYKKQQILDFLQMK